MFTRKVLASLAAAGLVFGSTAASAATAERTASPVKGESLQGGWAWILALLIVVGVIAVIASDGSEDAPTSP
jgi:hypothetical protein